MAQQSMLSYTEPSKPWIGAEPGTKDAMPLIIRSNSDPTSIALENFEDEKVEEFSRTESRDTIREPTPRFSHYMNLRIPTPRHSYSTYLDSPVSSRPNSPLNSSLRRSLRSSATSATVFTVDTYSDLQAVETRGRRPSLLTRIRSSMGTSAASLPGTRKLSIQPSDFQLPPEQPEKHFIDSVGMVIPGVSNRSQCTHPLAHFITTWRLCEPIEYTTALADHGVTYTDYCRLIKMLANFLDELPNESKRRANSKASWWHPKNWQTPKDNLPLDFASDAIAWKSNPNGGLVEQPTKVEQQSVGLNRLLEEITWNWQARGLPVMVCVGSFSLFAPNHISESHIQLLHVSLGPSKPPVEVEADSRIGHRLSFIDPFEVIQSQERSVSMPNRKDNRRSISPESPKPPKTNNLRHHHQQLQFRDRTRPWPLWPNAIPSRKREMMNGCIDRYGGDPYFRAWVRANINSRTTSTSYAKYMIEREDNPFINKRLEYITPPSRATLIWTLLTQGYQKWKEQSPSTINRANYEHNRKLECRKTVEHGSRLRIVRFGFRHPLYPPHTPEMDELGLTKEAYQAITSNIEDIRKNHQAHANECVPHILASWNKLRHRSTEGALAKVSEYIRQLNASQRRIVWTIERIPGVYARGIGRNKKEWEISAWNGEDPLDLLIQLEKWGIIDKRLSIDDDD